MCVHDVVQEVVSSLILSCIPGAPIAHDTVAQVHIHSDCCDARLSKAMAGARYPQGPHATMLGGNGCITGTC